MSWRNRKMFDDLPQGIVSGLAPIPRYKEGGFVNPIDYRAGGTVDYPVGMEAGSLVPQVFESGDQQINEALNNMVSAMTPQATKVPLPDVTDPAPKLENAVTDKAETDLEPTGKKEIFLDEVEKQRDLLQEAIKTFVQEKDITKDSMEQFTLELQSFTDKAEDLFKDTVRDAAQRLDVDIDITNITLMTDEFDQEMSTTFPEIEAVFSGTAEEPQAPLTMEDGGYVEEKIKQQEEIIERLEKLYEDQLAIGDRGPLGGGTSYVDQAKQRLDAARARLELFKQEGTTAEIVRQELFKAPYRKELYEGELGSDSESSEEEEETLEETPEETPDLLGSKQLTLEERLTPYYERLKNLQRNVTAAGLMSGKTKQGGLAGFFDVVGQAQGAGAKAGAAGDELMIRALAGSRAERDYLREAIITSVIADARATGETDPEVIKDAINTALSALKLSEA